MIWVHRPQHVSIPKQDEFSACRWQDSAMGANAELLGLMGPQLELLLPGLDEKGRRLALGAVARAAGDGGVTAGGRMTGAAWQTVAGGAAEVGAGQYPPGGRGRRPRGGAQSPAQGP